MAEAEHRPITVALVDDYDVVLMGVAKMFDRYRDRVVVAELDSNMGVEDAVLELSAGGRSFLVFRQAASERIAVLFRRRQQGFHLPGLGARLIAAAPTFLNRLARRQLARHWWRG